ncbi:hypothetical protein N2152v2_000298 [Parachlorella kessleri]
MAARLYPVSELVYRAFPVVQRPHLSACCKRWVAAAVGQPGSSREGNGAGPDTSCSSLSSSSSSSSRDEDAIAAVLAAAGLDPAELEQQAPDAYSELSPALAQVLAEVVGNRVVSSNFTRVPAAELMARICFLAWEVGLTAAEIRDGHRRYWRFLSFTLDSSRRLHSWLQLQHLSTDQLRLASRNYSTLWALDAVTFQRNKEHVQQQLDPGALSSNLDSLLAAEPCLRASSPWLLRNSGTVLSCSPETLLCKVKFLRQNGFDEEQLSRVLRACPMVLSSNLEDKIKPILAALQSVLGSQEGVVAAVVKAPSLLVAALETIDGNVGVLKELDMSSADIMKSVSRQPQLFACDYRSEDFQTKLRYFEAVLGRTPRHMLLEQPMVLKSALKKVDYRVSFMEQKGDIYHKATLSWISWSDTRFCERYRYSTEEYEGWREQWVHSERARLYGLDKADVPGMARALQARDRRNRAKVAARREEVLAAGEEQG